MLKICNVSKSFGVHKILDSVSLMIDRSKIIGFAGSSGSGKSTLLRLFQKLDIPDSGTIESEVRTGFVFQDFQLFPHMTVWKNITYTSALRKVDMSYIGKAEKFISLLGLTKKVDLYPAQLSGGQKQRVALARTLMIEPDILLCDEPTSGLDVATIDDVTVLMESVKALGIGIVIASHDLDFLTKIADMIFVLKNAKLTDPIYPKDLDNPIEYIKGLYYEES